MKHDQPWYGHFHQRIGYCIVYFCGELNINVYQMSDDIGINFNDIGFGYRTD